MIQYNMRLIIKFAPAGSNLFLSAVIIFSIACGTASAVEIRLYPPHAFSGQNGNLLICCTTKRIVNDEVIKFINVGVTTTFSYYIILYEKNFLLDQEIRRMTIHKRVEFDIWSEMYRMESDYPEKTVFYYRNFSDIGNQLSSLDNISFIPMQELNPQKKYYFNTRVTIKITQLDSWMHLIFNFLSIFKYRTTWESGKSRPGSFFRQLTL
ncbi:MAG TPA: hypothetical protein DC049_16170 [Spirochaetia bacterium]|nr:hypothetical protein [Spirochaetia bacterium]